MFVGYATDHDGDIYRMWDPRSKRVQETRDVIWLRRMFYSKQSGEISSDFDIVAPATIYRDPAPTTGAGEGGNIGEAAATAPPVAVVPVVETVETDDNEEEEATPNTRSGRAVRVPQ
jgi:hypothetical protein